VDQFIASFKTTPEELVLDFDATDNPLYGQQEGRFFHGYYSSYCYLPLYVFCGQQLLCAYATHQVTQSRRSGCLQHAAHPPVPGLQLAQCEHLRARHEPTAFTVNAQPAPGTRDDKKMARNPRRGRGSCVLPSPIALFSSPDVLPAQPQFGIHQGRLWKPREMSRLATAS
jgi:Transposase DDE domain group 1